jgi:hypothetical protein
MNNKKLIVVHRGFKNLPSFDIFGPVPTSVRSLLYTLQSECDIAKKFEGLGYTYVGSMDFGHEHNNVYQNAVNELIAKGWHVQFVGFEDNVQLFAELRRTC